MEKKLSAMMPERRDTKTRCGVMTVAISVAIFSLALLSDGSANAKSGSDGITNGKKIYIKHCAGCHGPEGKGDGYSILSADPANLTPNSIRKKTDATLLRSIHEGKGMMPSWSIRLSQQDTQDVLTYIHSLPK